MFLNGQDHVIVVNFFVECYMKNIANVTLRDLALVTFTRQTAYQNKHFCSELQYLKCLF